MRSTKFDYHLNFDSLDFRKNPQLYRVGRGEQGVLLVEPYKSEILPHWRFRTPVEAQKSARSIFKMFKEYEQAGDFAGMDMARKFLQMGFTRARRYANHKSGKKYLGPVPLKLRGTSGSHGRKTLPLNPDKEKAESAAIFKKALDRAEKSRLYSRLKTDWKLNYG